MIFRQKILFLLTVIGISVTTLNAQEKTQEKVEKKTEEKAEEKPKVKIGGSVRFNYNLSSWKDGQQKRGGDFGFNVFRVNAKGNYKGFKANAEYHFYASNSGGSMLKHGWIGYDVTPEDDIKFGLTQVPFGIEKYSSFCWFLNLNYYAGFELDYDMGIKYTHKGKEWEYALAFFKNAQELKFGNNSDLSDDRFSYDLGSMDVDGDGVLDIRTKEINQFNARLIKVIGNSNVKHKLGVSGEYGGIYDLNTEETGDRHALAAHYHLKAYNFQTKAQVTYYKFNPVNTTELTKDVIAMTAYGSPYLVASEAKIYTLGASYTFPIKSEIISKLKIYDDFGYMDKKAEQFEDSLMNTIGVYVRAGDLFAFVDLGAGKNHSWLGPDPKFGFSKGTPDSNWDTRLNINIGYFF